MVDQRSVNRSIHKWAFDSICSVYKSRTGKVICSAVLVFSAAVLATHATAILLPIILICASATAFTSSTIWTMHNAYVAAGHNFDNWHVIEREATTKEPSVDSSKSVSFDPKDPAHIKLKQQFQMKAVIEDLALSLFLGLCGAGFAMGSASCIPLVAHGAGFLATIGTGTNVACGGLLANTILLLAVHGMRPQASRGDSIPLILSQRQDEQLTELLTSGELKDIKTRITTDTAALSNKEMCQNIAANCWPDDNKEIEDYAAQIRLVIIQGLKKLNARATELRKVMPVKPEPLEDAHQ